MEDFITECKEQIQNERKKIIHIRNYKKIKNINWLSKNKEEELLKAIIKFLVTKFRRSKTQLIYTHLSISFNYLEVYDIYEGELNVYKNNYKGEKTDLFTYNVIKDMINKHNKIIEDIFNHKIKIEELKDKKILYIHIYDNEVWKDII